MPPKDLDLLAPECTIVATFQLRGSAPELINPHLLGLARASPGDTMQKNLARASESLVRKGRGGDTTGGQMRV